MYRAQEKYQVKALNIKSKNKQNNYDILQYYKNIPYAKEILYGF